MPIIFNGDTLVVHHNPSDSPFLLVTFIGSFHEHQTDHNYLMRNTVERSGIACIGVTTRVRNLFICDEIKAVAALVQTKRRRGQKMIILGQSSGGYACLKFADLFGADYVLAVAPVFSMDVDDLGLTEEMREERQFLQDAIRFHKPPREIIRTGMRPGPEDCSVPTLFLYDNHVESDTYAIERYMRLFPQARYLRARNFGHAVLERLDERSQWYTVLSHLANDDVGSATNLLMRLTRNNEAAIAELMVRIARWRPRMVPVALETARAKECLTHDARPRQEYNNILAYELAARGDVAGAWAHLRSVHPTLFPQQSAPSANTADDQAGRGLFLVLSWHGDVLSYDNSRAQVVLSPGTLHAKGPVPALLDLRGPTPRVVIQMRAGEVDVVLDEESAAGQGPGFEVERLEHAMVAFRRGNLYLQGRRRSVPPFFSHSIQEWERYALLPVPQQEVLREKTGLNWFDEAVVAVRTEQKAPLSAEADSARRKASFRSFLRFFSG